MDNELDEALQLVGQQYLESIQEQLINFFQDSIQEAVYDVSDQQMSYEYFQRTDALKEAVTAEFDDDGALIVFINPELLEYYSYVNFVKTDTEESENVPMFVEGGHDSSASNQYGMFKNYEARDYLGLAQQKIQEAFPDLKVEILQEE